MKGVYVAGDGLFGPATVVEGIRDGKKAAEAIVGRIYLRISSRWLMLRLLRT